MPPKREKASAGFHHEKNLEPGPVRTPAPGRTGHGASQEFQGFRLRPRLRSGQDEGHPVAGIHLEDHLQPAGCGQDLPGDPPRHAAGGRRHARESQEVLREAGHRSRRRHHLHHQRTERFRNLQLLGPEGPGMGEESGRDDGPAFRRVPPGRLLLHQQQEGRGNRRQGGQELDRIPPGADERGRPQPGRRPREGRQPEGQGHHQVPELV